MNEEVPVLFLHEAVCLRLPDNMLVSPVAQVVVMAMLMVAGVNPGPVNTAAQIR